MNTPQTATCPCCQNVFDSTDQPDEYKRIVEWSAARELGRRNAGVKKHLTPEQRQAKAQVLARNRANARYKLQVVNDATGETQDSLLKGADMLSSAEANQIIKKGGLVPGFHYVKVRV